MWAATESFSFAQGLMRRGMYSDAAKELEARLRSGESVEAQVLLAQCYEKLGRTQEAIGLYRSVMAASSGETRLSAQLRLGDLLLSAGKVQEAVPYLETVATTRKDANESVRLAGQLRLGQAYEALGRYQDAITLFRLVEAAGGETGTYAKRAVAEAYAKMGQNAAALEQFDKILAEETLSETDREAVSLAAFSVAYQEKNFERATTYALGVSEKTLATRQALVPAAWAALQAKRPEQARGWLAAEKLARPQSTAERLMLEGAIASAMGDSLGAITAYERILSEHTRNKLAPDAAGAMLQLRAAAGDPEAFLQAYNRVATLLPQEAVTRFAPTRLDAALQTQQTDQAQAAAAWLMEQGTPEQAADAGYRLGYLAMSQEQFASAGETWLRTAERWPAAESAPQAALGAAYAFLQAGMTERAAQAINQALAFNRSEITAKALMLKARMELTENDTASAGTTLDEVLTRFPEGESMAEAAYLRGLLFFNAQDFAAAEARLQQALSATEAPLDHTRTVDAQLRRAQSLHALGRGDEAAELLQPLIELKDAAALQPAYLAWLAGFRADRKEWPEAEAAARVLLTKQPLTVADRVLGHHLLARAAEGQGQFATAIASEEAALVAAQEGATIYDAEAALGLGRLRLQEGQAEKAKEAFLLATTRAEEGTVQAVQAFAGLAEACGQLGESAEALRANMNLIIFYDDPVYVPEAFRRAIALLEAQGRTEEATRLREELAQRYPNQE